MASPELWLLILDLGELIDSLIGKGSNRQSGASLGNLSGASLLGRHSHGVVVRQRPLKSSR